MILAKRVEVLELGKISGYGLPILFNCPAGASYAQGVTSFNVLNFIIWFDITMQCLKQRQDIGHFPTKIAGCLNNYSFNRTKFPGILIMISELLPAIYTLKLLLVFHLQHFYVFY